MMTDSVSWICNSFFLSSCFQSNVYLLEKTCQNAGGGVCTFEIHLFIVRSFIERS